MRVVDPYSENILEIPARDSQEDLFPSRLRRRGPRILTQDLAQDFSIVFRNSHAGVIRISVVVISRGFH